MSAQFFLLPAAQERWRWWRAPLALLLFVFLAVVLITITTFVKMSLGWPMVGRTPLEQFQEIAFAFLTIALCLLPAWLVGRWILGLQLGAQSSVWQRFRWPLFLRALGLACLPFVLLAFVDVYRTGAQFQPEPYWPHYLLLTVLLVPLQCAAEEFAFRGLLPQAFASWWLGRSAAAEKGSSRAIAVLALVLSALLFALIHGEQNAPMFTARLGLGLIFAYLAYQTQGLEASIALHMANNAVLMLQGTATSTLYQNITSTTATWTEVLLQLVVCGLTAWLIARWFQKKKAAAAISTAF